MSSSAPLADCAFARCGIARLASPADAVRRNSLRLIVIWSCSRTRTLPRGPVVISQEQDRGQARDWLKSGQFHKTWRNDLAHAVSLSDEKGSSRHQDGISGTIANGEHLQRMQCRHRSVRETEFGVNDRLNGAHVAADKGSQGRRAQARNGVFWCCR